MPSKYASRKRALDEMRKRGIATPLLEDIVGEGPMKPYARESVKSVEPNPVEIQRTTESSPDKSKRTTEPSSSVRSRVKSPLEEYEIEAEEGPKLKRKVDVDVDDSDKHYDRSGKMLGFSKGGSVSSASHRADGIAQRGKTKGRYI